MFRRFLNEKTGFTLVEMITVIVIAGIIFSIGLPMMKGVLMGNRLQISAQKISNTLALARSEAIAKRKNVRVMFNTNNNSYWIEMDSGSDTVGIGKVHYLPDTIDFDPGAEPRTSGYEFKPTGGVMTSKNFKIIDTTNNKFRQIHINLTTGRIKISLEN